MTALVAGLAALLAAYGFDLAPDIQDALVQLLVAVSD